MVSLRASVSDGVRRPLPVSLTFNGAAHGQSSISAVHVYDEYGCREVVGREP